jgi:hypothetical protein
MKFSQMKKSEMSMMDTREGHIMRISIKSQVREAAVTLMKEINRGQNGIKKNIDPHFPATNGTS